MQLCMNCQYENPEGEMFCRRCGVALGALSVNTTQLGEQDDNLIAGGLHLSNDHVVFLHVAGHTEPIALQIADQIVMGRESGEGRLNLERYEAITLGVSRHHAMLFTQEDRLFIRDLGSTNRTYINGQELDTSKDYDLRDGDEVMLGRLVFKLFFK